MTLRVELIRGEEGSERRDWKSVLDSNDGRNRVCDLKQSTIFVMCYSEGSFFSVLYSQFYKAEGNTMCIIGR